MTREGTEGTLTGGTGGSGNNPEDFPPASSAASELSELATALDSALGAVSGMFAAAVRPSSIGARKRLDEAYETLITSVEVFRETVPKA